MENKDKIMLCGACATDFRNCSTRKIRRTQNQEFDTCDFCQFRLGREHKYVEPKRRRK